MDDFDGDELYQIRSFFYKADYRSVLKEPIDNLTRSDEAALYQYRARIELGDARGVATDMDSAGTTGAGFEVVKAFAEYRSGEKTKSVADIEELVQADGDDTTVQVIGATVLYAEGKVSEALELLMRHENNLEAVALIIQIQLAQNNIEGAEKTLAGVKSWAQDTLLQQLAEAWVGLVKDGDATQGAFYIYEELAQTSGGTAEMLNGQGAAEILLARFPEAESTLRQALEKNPQDASALANSLVCATLSGKDSSSYLNTLMGTDHPLVRDLQEKSALFDTLAAGYSPTVV